MATGTSNSPHQPIDTYAHLAHLLRSPRRTARPCSTGCTRSCSPASHGRTRRAGRTR
ncbi:hypothetical protein N7U49_19585 [Streptomyces sp. AD2-2]|nr:hypothetical protein N7U49_19585 [Streptomyces sp. AD2-2]